ncbi:MAG TPA: AAA family ATPase [Acidobacteriota bacterium]|nr:AAA family ATPase [Acidobacteriota bacterium]
MIKRFRVQNYKALRDVTLELTPLHVLIGPNDSGKTSILEAIAALCRTVDHRVTEAFTGLWEGTELVWRGSRDAVVTFEVNADEFGSEDYEYGLACKFGDQTHGCVIKEEFFRFASEQPSSSSPRSEDRSWAYSFFIEGEPVSGNVKERARMVHDALAGVHYYCWNPRHLALPVAPDSKRRFRMESSGFGLALCLDDILGFDRDRFTSLEARFRLVFPQIGSIKLLPQSAFRTRADDPRQILILEKAEGKGIYFQFSGVDQLVPASQTSDGVLLVLAYLAILYLPKPPRVVLVEEPENGIHPKRLQDVLTVLRELVGEQSHTQVILTTHSPYVLDLFKPEEVTLCQKMPDGSVSVHRLSESATVREQLDVFTLGEIWTAEGDEALAKSDSDRVHES